ncbi:hypothetical protein [Clostridium sp. BSD9I1]|nr:hypothetical protein [Clostridium sp. BSD9I1]
MLSKGYEVGGMDILINGSIDKVHLIKISEESGSNFSVLMKVLKKL